MFGIGIIGCGWAGTRHAEAILSEDLRGRAQLVAIADVREGVLTSAGLKWGVPENGRYLDYGQMLEQAALDAVSVCLPHHLHAPASIAALEAGPHVLVEKPIAITLEQVDAMTSAAERHGRVLMVAETMRFSPVHREAARLVQEGKIGEPFLVRISREHKMHDYLRKRPWFLNQEQAGGGIMMAGGIHDMEAMRMLCGEPAWVFGVQARKALAEMEGDDTSLALMMFANGAVGLLQESFSTIVPGGGRRTFAIYGRDGTVEHSQPNRLLLTLRRRDSGEGEVSVEVEVPEANTFELEISHFLDCIESGAEPLTSAREARKSLAAVLAVYESMRTGQRVYVTD